jgi:hypothetical protein
MSAQAGELLWLVIGAVLAIFVVGVEYGSARWRRDESLTDAPTKSPDPS